MRSGEDEDVLIMRVVGSIVIFAAVLLVGKISGFLCNER